MQGWLRAWGRPVPTTTPGILPQIPSRAPAPHMSSIPPQPDTSQMSGMHGTQFDRTFRQAMIAHRRDAVARARNELTYGANPAAKRLAQEIEASQSAEISQMQRLLSSAPATPS